MSGGLDALSLKEDDVKSMLSASTHLGTSNMDFQMTQYIYKRKSDGLFTFLPPCRYLYKSTNVSFFTRTFTK